MLQFKISSILRNPSLLDFTLVFMLEMTLVLYIWEVQFNSYCLFYSEGNAISTWTLQKYVVAGIRPLTSYCKQGPV